MHSLDFGYLYAWQAEHELIAIEAHNKSEEARDNGPKSQLELLIGDTIMVDWNIWQLDTHQAGWTRGGNRRTGQWGFFPEHKAVERWSIVPFPAFNLSTMPDQTVY